jgi:hypothetical protein
MNYIFALLLSVSLTAQAADLPDPKLSPGQAYQVSPKLLCTPNYTSGYVDLQGNWYAKGQPRPDDAVPVRNVKALTEKAVWAEYGVQNYQGYCRTDSKYVPGTNTLKDEKDPDEGCEIDHIISLILSGSNNKENLWPQTYNTEFKWNAHRKDVLEVKLHKMVCAGKIDITEAQHAISTDWRTAYIKYVDPSYAQYLK